MSKNPKDSFLKRLEGRHFVKRVYGKSFYELNSTAILYFRYSKAHKNQFFFGVESDDLLNHKDKNLFILFICETEEKHLREINEKELREILVLLSSPFISITLENNGTYSAKYSHIQSLEKLKNIFKILLSPLAKE